MNGGESKALVFNYNIDNPKLWSPDAPNLYKTEVLRRRRRVRDDAQVRFGVE
ncbi:MAG: hypothetical protein J6Q93_06325, partial [Prevotella sp.]|nr:hypothetical protein [Prevotella sp.]